MGDAMPKLTFTEELRIRDIMDWINETDSALIDSILAQAAKDDSVKAFYLDPRNFLYPTELLDGTTLWLPKTEKQKG